MRGPALAWWGGLTALLFWLPLTSLPAEESGGWQWLERMGEAMRGRDYVGTFIYMRGDHMETLKVVHRATAAGERERLISLTGAAREVIRSQDRLTCVWPSSGAVYIEPRNKRTALPVSLPVNGADLMPHYRLDLGETTRIAGRFCQLLKLAPRDEYRYGYRLCIDQQSHLLLLSELRSQDGQVIEKVQFTRMQQPAQIADEWLESVLVEDDFKVYRAQESSHHDMTPDQRWQVKKLPPGFTLHDNSKRIVPVNDAPVQHMIFSDGLASVSVFIAAEDAHWVKQSHLGPRRAGSVNAYTDRVNGHSVVALGEVPAATVEMIGQSVYYAKD